MYLRDKDKYIYIYAYAYIQPYTGPRGTAVRPYIHTDLPLQTQEPGGFVRAYTRVRCLVL